MNSLILRLGKTTFDIKRVSETISLLDSVAQHGVDSLDNFTGAINLMSDLSYENCKRIKALFEELHALTIPNKTSKGGDAA